LLSALASAALGAACVVTTYEGPSEPPRVAPPPPLPGVSSPGKPFSESSNDESALDVGDAEALEGGPGVTTGPREVVVSHVLVMYRGSMRAPPTVDRSKQEALVRAQQVLARAKAGEDFGVLAAEFSDEPGAALRRGKIGKIRRDQVVKPFADAAFALEVGQLSGIIETPFGYHVILRTE
jgi:peptidyl-prolyl cis-trans isomerase NIMA-interacting 1